MKKYCLITDFPISEAFVSFLLQVLGDTAQSSQLLPASSIFFGHFPVPPPRVTQPVSSFPSHHSHVSPPAAASTPPSLPPFPFWPSTPLQQFFLMCPTVHT